LAHFVLFQTKSVTKNIRFYLKTPEGRTKGAWEPHSAIRIVVENHLYSKSVD